jgi:hypothetical protein
MLLLVLLLVFVAKLVLHVEPPTAKWLHGFHPSGIVIAPPIETGLMQFGYYLLHFVIWRGRALRVLVLALLAASAHALEGGWGHAVGVFWPFLVMSTALAAWEERRVWDAFIVVTAIHVLNNATLFATLFAINALLGNAAQTDLSLGSSCASSFQCAGTYTCFGSPPVCRLLFGEGHECSLDKECAGIMQCTAGRCAAP